MAKTKVQEDSFITPARVDVATTTPVKEAVQETSTISIPK